MVANTDSGAIRLKGILSTYEFIERFNLVTAGYVSLT